LNRDIERVVRAKSKLTGSHFAVMLAIARYADDEGKGAFPSVATLAKDTRRSHRTVQYAIKHAVQLDELKVFYNYGPNGTNQYEIRLDKLGDGLLCTGAKSAHKGSSLKGRQYSSASGSASGSAPESSSGASVDSESVATPKPKNWRRWAKRGDPDWQCPICLQVGCPGCPGYITDEELNATFDAAMRDTLDSGKPGPAQEISEQLLSEAHKPSAFPSSSGIAAGRKGENRRHQGLGL
jgi:hypothetical protein